MKILCHICENLDENNIYSLLKKIKICADMPKYKQKMYYNDHFSDIREGTGLAKSTIMVKCGYMKREGIIDISEDSKYIYIKPKEDVIPFLEGLKSRNRTKSDEEYLQAYRKLDEDTWFYQEVLKILWKSVNKYNLSWDTYSVFMESAGMTYKEVVDTIMTLEKEGLIERIKRNTKIIYIFKVWTEAVIGDGV